MADYLLCGWRLRSDVDLPELLPWTGDDRTPDVRLRLDVVPDRLDGAVDAGPLLQIGTGDVCRFGLRRVGAYLLRQGREIVVQPAAGGDAASLRAFLFGTVFGILAHQRGLLPLHASCIRVGDAAVAFAGRSGTGKSTLAATFLRRGHAVLADDVTVVDPAHPQGPHVLPAFPRLKLWQDAVTALAWDTGQLQPVRPELRKYLLPVGTAAFCAEPLPLSAVIRLETVNDPRHAGLEQLRGLAAVSCLQAEVYRLGLLSRMGDQALLQGRALRLAAALRGLYRLARGHDHADRETLATDILARLS